MPLFISHARRDSDLVELLRRSLPLAGAKVVVYEDLPPPAQGSSDAKRIKALIRDSSAVFLFHTQTVESNEFTKAWVHYEVSQASAHDKDLVVFQPLGIAPKMPITYFTDVAPLDLQAPGAVPDMQLIARGHEPRLHERPLARIAAGAAGGAIFGPIGMGIGAFAGLISTPRKARDSVPNLQCTKCQVAFRFWGKKQVQFHCPGCLQSVKCA